MCCMLIRWWILQDMAVERADYRRMPQGSVRVHDRLRCGQILALVSPPQQSSWYCICILFSRSHSCDYIHLHHNRLRPHEQLAHRLSSFQIPMNGLNVLQVVDLVNLDGDLLLLDEPEEFFGVMGEFFSGADVTKHLRSEQFDAFRCEFAVSIGVGLARDDRADATDLRDGQRRNGT